jgi:SAM-dependent methyltransferase
MDASTGTSRSSTHEEGTSIGETRPPSACPICADRQPPERHELREMLFGTRERFGYLRCRGCGAMRIATVPSDLSGYYPPDYYDGGGSEPGKPRSRRRAPLAAVAGAARDRALLLSRRRRIARWTRHWAPPVAVEVQRASGFTRRAGLHSFNDPILDVGCGRRATNLANLKDVGFRRLLGIDPFLEADTEFAGIPLRRRSLQEQPGTFQAITFHHSFEHVPDPEATLLAAAHRLRPGGVILVRTPVMGTWFWERFGTTWWELDPPRHLWIHTQASLEILARRVGLALVDVVWDSSYLEVIASEQIGRDVAWREPGSWFRDPPAGFDAATIAGYKAQVAELNRDGRAGRAGFYFRRLDRAAEPAAMPPTSGIAP